MFPGKASAGGTAGLDGFEPFTAYDTAANPVNDVAQDCSHGNLDDSCIDNIPCQCKYLCARALLCTKSMIPAGTIKYDGRHIGQRLHVIDDGRAFKQALFKWERRFLPWLSPLSLNGCQQGGFLAADKGACTDTDFQIKGKSASHDIPAQYSGLPGLVNGIAQTFHCNWIFRTHIHISLGCTDCISTQHHALNNAVGVAFQNTSVHECTGVSFIRIADHELPAVL